MKRRLALTVLFCGLVCSASGQVALEWNELPELPPQSGATMQPGLAGAFAGISNNALIVAGGTTFPEPVWESDQIWHDDIYVLIRDSDVDESYHWITGQKLERPCCFRCFCFHQTGRCLYRRQRCRANTFRRVPAALGTGKRTVSLRSRCRVSPHRVPTRVLQSLAKRSTSQAEQRDPTSKRPTEPSGRWTYPKLMANGSVSFRGRAHPGGLPS